MGANTDFKVSPPSLNFGAQGSQTILGDGTNVLVDGISTTPGSSFYNFDNSDGAWDNGASKIFTAPEDGVYCFTAQIGCTSTFSGGDTYGAAIAFNGTPSVGFVGGNTVVGFIGSAVALYALETGDTVSLYMSYTTSGDPETDTATFDINFTGFKV